MTSLVTVIVYILGVMAGRTGEPAAKARIATIWDERYSATTAPAAGATKEAEVVQAAKTEGLLDLRPWSFNEARAWAGVKRVHDAVYADAIRTGEPRALAESSGFTWSRALARSAVSIWAGHAVACRLAQEEGVVLHPVSGAHHARRSRGSGFCTFNFLVGAGLQLLDSDIVRKVAIVDLDAHQGDGTWQLVQNDARFGIFDVSGTDWVGERESGRAVMRVVSDAEGYRRAVALLPRFLDRFQPDLVQYQAGMDCHEEDLAGGIPGVGASLLASRDRFVIETVVARRIPLVIDLAGGYQPNERTVSLHLGTIRIATRLAGRRPRR